jgi:hypothetical protein
MTRIRKEGNSFGFGINAQMEKEAVNTKENPTE